MLSESTIEVALGFRRRRAWEQFHSPRNLAAAISVEASELLELFLWASDDQVNEIVQRKQEEISNEIADIALLLTYLAHDLSIDLDSAVRDKLRLNEQKYPEDKSYGSNKKYTDL